MCSAAITTSKYLPACRYEVFGHSCFSAMIAPSRHNFSALAVDRLANILFMSRCAPSIYNFCPQARDMRCCHAHVLS